MFGVSKAYAYAAVALAALTAFGVYSRYLYKSGVDSERAAVVERSLDRQATRNQDDEELRNKDLDGLCVEYGGTRWLPDEQRCERR